MNQLQAMRVFLKVAENGSFGRAAASLDLSNAIVTRYVALLETHLDTRLVNRTARSLSLTEAGLTSAGGCRHLLDHLDTMETSIARSSSDPSGTLKLVAEQCGNVAPGGARQYGHHDPAGESCFR